MMRFYALEILRIGLGFTGRFPYAGELQILLLKTSPKQASEEGLIMTDQTLGRSDYPFKKGQNEQVLKNSTASGWAT